MLKSVSSRRAFGPAVSACAAACLFAAAASAQTPVSGNIAQNTTWTVGGSPYIIQSTPVLVKSNSTLQIDPGVEVRFDPGTSLETDAGSSIVAIGTPGDSIFFTSNAPSPVAGDWLHVQIFASSGSEFQHCVFEYGLNAMYVNDSAVVDITYCTFRHCWRSIWVRKASPNIESCWIVNSDYYGIWCEHYTSSPYIYNCNLIDNPMNLRLEGYSQPAVVDARFNWWGTFVKDWIEEKIVDVADSVGTLGEVIFEPYLEEVPVEATSWGRIKALFKQ